MARTHKTKDGVSLAKGPVALLGAVMLAYGVLALLLGGNGFQMNAPSGDVQGETFLSLEGNGWTNLLWIAGGALLLFGSPFHWGAKSTALIVGLALGAASVIAMFDGFDTGDVLGIFATNPRTILALGAASAYLLITAFLPKVGKKRDRDVVAERPVHTERVEPVRETRETEVVAPASTTARDRDLETGRFDRERSDRIVEDPQVRAAQDAERGTR